MRRFLLPCILLLAFFSESIFVQLLPAELFNSERIIIPHFLLIVLIFVTIYGKTKYGIIYGITFGFLADMVFTEILGIYLFLFPLMAYLVSLIMKIFHSNVVIAVIVSMLGVALVELGSYEMNFLIKITQMDFSTFIELRLLPTLLLNLTFAILFIYPVKRFSEKMVFQLEND